jgi:hypothetical protein
MESNEIFLSRHLYCDRSTSGSLTIRFISIGGRIQNSSLRRVLWYIAVTIFMYLTILALGYSSSQTQVFLSDTLHGLGSSAGTQIRGIPKTGKRGSLQLNHTTLDFLQLFSTCPSNRKSPTRCALRKSCWGTKSVRSIIMP